MRLALLTSGGKDGTLAGHVVESQGWEVTHLVTVEPASAESYMFHVPNLHLVPLQAEAWGKRHVRVSSSGEPERELSPLESALAGLPIDGLVTGAVASEYQRTRIDAIGHRLGLKTFAPLWHKRGEDVLETLLAGAYDVRVSAVAADGLDRSWLGRRIDRAALADLVRLRSERGIHVAGEGGEYETLVLDAPGWSRRIELCASEASFERDRGTWRVLDAALAPKRALPA